MCTYMHMDTHIDTYTFHKGVTKGQARSLNSAVPESGRLNLVGLPTWLLLQTVGSFKGKSQGSFTGVWG